MKEKHFLLWFIIFCILNGTGLGEAQAEAISPAPEKKAYGKMVGSGPARVLELSVEEAVIYALQNNRDLHVRRLTPVIVGTFEEIERGAFDPEVFVEAEYSEESSTETARSTGTQFTFEGSERAASVGIRKFMATGTSIEGAVEQFRSLSDRAPEQQVARVGLTVSQALLRGFGPAVNLVDVRQAEMDTVASIYELRGFVEALLAEAETAYWNYVLAKEEIAIFKSSLAVAQQQREETERRIEVGLLPKFEVAAVRAEVALRQQALIDARSNLEDRRLRLLRLTNPDSGDTFQYQVEATSDPRVDAKPIRDLDAHLQLAVKLRPDLNESILRLQQQRLETVVTRNGLLPRLDLFISLGKTGFADSFSGSFKDLDSESYDVLAGLQLSHMVGNRAAEARHLAALNSREQAEKAVSNLRQLIGMDMRLAANELERVRLQIAATAATRSLREAALAAEKKRFEVGTSTNLQVAIAQRDLLESQLAEIESIIQYRIALVNLYHAEGSLLERRGIRL